jgi:hypothetical protein
LFYYRSAKIVVSGAGSAAGSEKNANKGSARHQQIFFHVNNLVFPDIFSFRMKDFLLQSYNERKRKTSACEAGESAQQKTSACEEVQHGEGV